MKESLAGQHGEPRRDAELSRLYADAPSETPPAALDAAILATARRAVRAKPRAAGPFARRWTVPFSLAAVVVLSVTLVTLSQRERSVERMDSAPGGVSRAVTGKAEAEAPRPAAPEVTAVEQAPADIAPAIAPMATPVDNRPAAKAAKKIRLKSGVARAEKRRLAVPLSLPAPSEGATARAQRARPASTAVGAGRESDSAVSEAPAAIQPEGAPKAWLDRIRALLAQGRRKEARAELARFRRRFPDYRLPPELRP